MTDTETKETDILGRQYRKPGGAHTRNFRGELELKREERSNAMAELEIKADNDAEETERGRKKEIAQKEADHQLDKFLDPNSTKKQKELATQRLKKLDNTLSGRQLFKKALAAKGLDSDAYAEMVEISAKVGRGESMELGRDGAPVIISADSKTALEARKHVTTSLDKVYDIDKKQEETAPHITIIIGEPFKEASEAVDERDKGHTVGPPRWTKASPEEPE